MSNNNIDASSSSTAAATDAADDSSAAATDADDAAEAEEGQQEQDDDHQNENVNEFLSLSERFDNALSIIETNPTKSVRTFTQLQHQVASLISVDTDTIQDISTTTIPFLTLEHYLAKSYTLLPMSNSKGITQRYQNLKWAVTLWISFFQKLDKLELLSKEEERQYQSLLDISDDSTSQGDPDTVLPPPPPNREMKIARYQQKQQLQQELDKLNSLKQRRQRLDLDDNQEMDGYDNESLERTLHISFLDMAKLDGLEEWSNTLRELPLIARMVQQQEQSQQQDNRYGNHNQNSNATDTDDDRQRRRPPNSNGKGLEVTHITQSPLNGQLQFRKENVKSQVFRPGWNQPTMTLEELGERELRDAIERETRQKQAAESQIAQSQPRRHEQLVRDGLEDNNDLVDASSAIDRKWDEFREQNPRGSGNKRGNVGDKNF